MSGFCGGYSLAKFQKCVCFSLSLIFFILSAFPSHAKLVVISDFDGTFIDDSRLNSSWKTPWVMRRVDRLSSSAQIDPLLRNLPDTIQISAAEYISYISKWSTRNGNISSHDLVQLSNDPFLVRPKVIVPGYYYVDPETTFQFYRTTFDGPNYLIQNYEEAMVRARRQRLSKDDFKGPAFPLVQNILKNPSTVGNLHIFTARDQSQDHFSQFLNRLKQDGHILHDVGLNKRGQLVEPTVHQLQGLESILYGRTLVEGKRSVVERIVKQLAHSSAELTSDYSITKPNVRKDMHTVIVAEDDPVNVQALVKLMRELSAGHSTRSVKLVLFNTGSDEILAASTLFHNRETNRINPWIVFDQGFIRFATLDEINLYTKGEPNGANPASNAKSCNIFLGRK